MGMSTPTLLLILWSVACLGFALSATHRLQDALSNVGMGLVLWSVGVGVWMVAGFIWRAI